MTTRVSVSAEPRDVKFVARTVNDRLSELEKNLNDWREKIKESSADIFDCFLGTEKEVQEARGTFGEMIVLERNIQANKIASVTLQTSYQFTENNSNFDSLFKVVSGDVNKDQTEKKVREDFDAAHCYTISANSNDDEIAIVMGCDGGLLNKTCPLTKKSVLALAKPVQDNKGYIYEESAIRDYLRRNQGEAECPEQGTAHTLRVSDLKDASRRIKRSKYRQNDAMAPERAEDVFLDAD